MHVRLELTKEICGNSILLHLLLKRFRTKIIAHSIGRSVGPYFDFLSAKVTLNSQSHCLQREDIASTVSSYTE